MDNMLIEEMVNRTVEYNYKDYIQHSDGTTYIYFLLDPRVKKTYEYDSIDLKFDYKPFYVGISQYYRHFEHANNAVKSEERQVKNDNQTKLDILRDIFNIVPREKYKKKFIVLTDKLDSKFEAMEKEKLYIKVIGATQNGGPLVNKLLI